MKLKPSSINRSSRSRTAASTRCPSTELGSAAGMPPHLGVEAVGFAEVAAAVWLVAEPLRERRTLLGQRTEVLVWTGNITANRDTRAGNAGVRIRSPAGVLRGWPRDWT